jgi:hypothetical protein
VELERPNRRDKPRVQRLLICTDPALSALEVRWYPEFGQEVKLGLILRRTDLDDEQTEAIFGGF